MSKFRLSLHYFVSNVSRRSKDAKTIPESIKAGAAGLCSTCKRNIWWRVACGKSALEALIFVRSMRSEAGITRACDAPGFSHISVINQIVFKVAEDFK